MDERTVRRYVDHLIDLNVPVRSVRGRAERLDWVPAVLAGLDRPFVIEHPATLRDQVRALAQRLAGYTGA